MIRAFTLLCILLFAGQVQADNTPIKPASLQESEQNGATVHFLGNEQGLNGWLVTYQNQNEIVYSTPDGQGVLIGLLFDGNKNPITPIQLQRAAVELGPVEPKNPISKIEGLYDRLETAPGAIYGKKGKTIHVFVDPVCPYCHRLWRELLPLANQGAIQLHIIPITILGPRSEQLAGSILGGNISSNWERLMNNEALDQTNLDYSLGQKLLAENMKLFTDWNGRAVPLLVYKSQKQINITEGVPQNMEALLGHE